MILRRLWPGILVVLSLWTGTAMGAETLRPLGSQDTVPVGRSAKPYLVMQDAPLVFPVTGPGTVTLYTRVPMSGPEAPPRKGSLQVAGLGAEVQTHPLEFQVTRSSRYGDAREGVPSGGQKTTLEVPAGNHRLELSGQIVGGGPALVIVYYDGPPQPATPGLMPREVTVKTPKGLSAGPKKSAWSFRGNAGFDLMYNTNVLTNSDEYLIEFQSGLSPHKFQHNTDDDFVFAPEFDIEARNSKLLPWGQTRFKFKFKHWLYTHNAIKTNTDFHFYGRQYFGKSRSLEGYFHFAPEQYIRDLYDRSPLDGSGEYSSYQAFNFQRNTWNLTWRQKINKKLSVKFIYERNYRYYNQPFMENDIKAWEVRGNATWKFNRTYTMNLDYSFEDGNGRGLDEVGEDILTSDNSDPSYERDLYRIGLTMKHKALRKFISQMDFSFLFMDYYYTTTKNLVQDPYHAGRRDTYYKATAEVRRKLTKTISAKAAVRRTERIVYSPWEGDITTDKDFTQWLYWVNLSYRF